MWATVERHQATVAVIEAALLTSCLFHLPITRASPLPKAELDLPLNTTALHTRDLPVPLNAGDWLPLNSVGMMLPVKPPASPGGRPANTVGNLQHMDFINPGMGAGSLPPGAPLKRNILSRDIIRKDAYVTFDPHTGATTYALRERDDAEGNDEEAKGWEEIEDDSNDWDVDDVDGDENSDTDENDQDDDKDGDDPENSASSSENGSTSAPEQDTNEKRALSKKGEPVLQGVSVLGTPSFKRSSGGLLARLFTRSRKTTRIRKTNSKSKSKSRSKPGKKRKGGKNKTGKKASRKSKSKSGKGRKTVGKKGAKSKAKLAKGPLNLNKLDLMKGATILTTITWYTGIDLLNPFCDRKSKWTPTDEALIIAVTEKWGLRPACGEFMEITTQDDEKDRSIIARVVDLCGGCIPEVAHADLSKAAFTKLYNLDVGRVSGLKMRRVGAPKEWSEKLYGPREL